MHSTTSAQRSWWGRVWAFIFHRGGHADDDLIRLNRRQVRRLIDDQARRDFGMSGEEFIAAFDRGELRESPLAQHLMLIAGERAGSESQRGAQAV